MTNLDMLGLIAISAATSYVIGRFMRVSDYTMLFLSGIIALCGVWATVIVTAMPQRIMTAMAAFMWFAVSVLWVWDIWDTRE